MSDEIPLKDRIDQFQREILRAVDTLNQINGLSRKLIECPDDNLDRELGKINQLLTKAKQTVRRSSVQVFKGNEQWGNGGFSLITSPNINSVFTPMSSGAAINEIASNHANLNMAVGATYTTQLEPDFAKLLNILIAAQDDYQIFKTLNIAKGKTGESLCHAFLPEIMDSSFWFLEGQKGLTEETTTEELAYQAAKELFTQNLSIKYGYEHEYAEYAIASRDFSGGDPYSLDSVLMLINRKDVANWEQSKRSTANYLVFECKTDKSQLSKAQSLPSYVQKQAKYMENNKRRLEDRHQLGKDLLQASSEGRTAYIAWHLDTSSGKVTARRIS
jgi:hypothetical protein